MKRPLPLADFVDPCLGKAIAAQGFTGSDLLLSWPDIVGERLGAVSQPIRIDWPRRPSAAERGVRPDPATLVVRVEGAFALDMQHLAPVLIERVNAVYGWRCVGRIVLKQGPVRRSTPPAPSPPLDARDRERIAAAVAAVGPEPLRAALERLGQAVAVERVSATSGPPGSFLPQVS